MAGKWLLGVAVVGLLAVASCSSDAKPQQAPSDTTSSGTVTPTASPSVAITPTPVPSSSAPLSPFENDPAVIALRAWAAQSAKDFNDGQNYTDPALLALETVASAQRVHGVYDEYIGTTFPGPFPLAPQAVRVVTPTHTQIDVCALDEGWAIDPATNVPAKPNVVDAVTFDMTLTDGRWLADGAANSTAFSCATVEVPTQTW